MCIYIVFILVLFITCIGEELSTLSIPSPATWPPPKNAVKIFRPTDNKLAQGDVGAIA